MRTYFIIALLSLALLLAGNTALQKYDAVKVANARLSKDLKDSKDETEAANAALLDLEKDLKFERELQIELQQTTATITNQLDQSKTLIMRLKRENKELSDWAAADLPVAVKRLRQRPYIIGARDYQNWLSSRERLHTERNQPADQRQSAD